MKDELLKIRTGLGNINEKAPGEWIVLFPGVELSYISFKSAPFSVRHKHNAFDYIIQINYCKSGQMEWKMGNGQYIYLNPGDFSLHTMNSCADSFVSFPTGQYSGLTMCINLQEIAVDPPELLKETDIFHEALQKKFCRSNLVSFLAGNEQTESIFSGFYHQPKNLKLPYQKIKALELLLYISKLEFTHQNQLTAYKSEQVKTIREIHDRLIQNIGERVTIEELSKQYLINPTTLKIAFKTVYGASIATHIKEHRMKKASEMLRETDMSIAEIAQAVGYDSQSKFAAAFKDFFQVLPREYKKNPEKYEKYKKSPEKYDKYDK